MSTGSPHGRKHLNRKINDKISNASDSNESYGTDDDVASLIDKPAKKRETKKKTNAESKDEQRSLRKESNRLSAHRSRQRQKMLEDSLQNQLDNLRLDKSDLETRFKNAVKKIFRFWPLPDNIPEEFSSLKLLLDLIDQVSSCYEVTI